jgi:2,4-dienoyl-CoA reductase-like NADH-dependent reductase (Old Yellow Enzyme family)
MDFKLSEEQEMFRAAVRGFATDWHLMTAGRYAAGGAGLMMVESTKVDRRGCGTMGRGAVAGGEDPPRPRPCD